MDATGVTFVVLPAGLEFAVLAEGLGPTGAVVANGCVDGVAIVADTDVETTVTMDDLPLMVTGNYWVEVEVGATDDARELERSVQRGGRAPVETAGGGASFLLDAIEAELRGRGDDAAADALHSARTTRFLDDMLDDRLTRDGAGPERAIDALAATVGERTSRIVLAGAAAIAEDGDALEASLATTGIFAAPMDGPSARLSIDLEALAIPTEGSLSLLRGSTEGALAIEELGAPLPLGSIGIGVLGALADEARVETPTELLREEAGCGVLEAWAGAEPAIATACDATCLATSCKQAMDTIVAGIDDAIRALDDTRAALTMSGALDVRDDAGDLRIDVIEGADLTGTWSSSDGSDSEPVSGSLTGARMLE